MGANHAIQHHLHSCAAMTSGVNSQWPAISWVSLAWNGFARHRNLVTRLYNSCHTLMMSFINGVHWRLRRGAEVSWVEGREGAKGGRVVKGGGEGWIMIGLWDLTMVANRSRESADLTCSKLDAEWADGSHCLQKVQREARAAAPAVDGVYREMPGCTQSCLCL